MPIQLPSRPVSAPMSRRRSRYQRDAEYRQKAQDTSRRAYRKKKNVELDSCLHSLKFLDEKVIVHPVVMPNGKLTECAGLSIPKTAELLQKLYQTVWRWIDTGMIPKPVLQSRLRPARPYPVYHIEEVRALIEEIGKHEKEVRYFRKDHHEVRERIAQRISEIRNERKFNEV